MARYSVYDSASEAIIDMHERGFADDFELSGNDLLWVQRKVVIQADEFIVIESHQLCSAGNRADIVILGVVMFCPAIKGILILRTQRFKFESLPHALMIRANFSCCSE